MKTGTGKYQTWIRRRYSSVCWDFATWQEAYDYLNQQHKAELRDERTDKNFRARIQTKYGFVHDLPLGE
jgi:hypothetical protein